MNNNKPDILAYSLEDIDEMTMSDLVIGNKLPGAEGKSSGVVEYLDVDETNNSMIAMTPDDLQQPGHWTPRALPSRVPRGRRGHHPVQPPQPEPKEHLPMRHGETSHRHIQH